MKMFSTLAIKGKTSLKYEVEHENKGKDIAHGEHLLSEKSSGYMKKELHRHHEDDGTALEILYIKRIIKLLPDLENKHIFTESFIRNT